MRYIVKRRINLNVIKFCTFLLLFEHLSSDMLMCRVRCKYFIDFLLTLIFKVQKLEVNSVKNVFYGIDLLYYLFYADNFVN